MRRRIDGSGDLHDAAAHRPTALQFHVDRVALPERADARLVET
jgi:hypothetical protein